jgi:hypothetical protein
MSVLTKREGDEFRIIVNQDQGLTLALSAAGTVSVPVARAVYPIEAWGIVGNVAA